MTAILTSDKAYSPDVEELARLESMGLTADYVSLGAKSRKKARLKVLRSWFDPDPARAHILCTDVDAFVRAHRLWVFFYLKPDPHNAGLYHFSDPLHKYEMVRMAMAEPLTHNQPAKAACVAPRGSTKTVTLIQEMCSLIAVARTTRNQILIAEMNADLTSDQIRNLRLQMENNETIHADFGGPGVLFPKGRSGGERWNDTTLCFQHTKSVIMGFSVASKQRGRHPTLGIIDDPEDEELSRNVEWRRKYFRWLFKTWMPMFGPGGKVMWIGTLIHEFSCLQLAMAGHREIYDATERDVGSLAKQSEDEPLEIERDERFDDWNRRVFRMIDEDPETGEEYSIFPQKMSVEDFQRYKKTYGASAAMSEFQGICVASGQFVFQRERHRHGFMRCLGETEQDPDYMLDLRTGKRMDWQEFMDSLYVVGAGDLSDSVATTADPGAVVIVGADPEGTVYVLDAYTRRCHADHLVHVGYEMCFTWNAQKLGWEKAAMQSVVVRYAARYGEQLRREGRVPPVCRPITNQRQDKTRRILAALTPLHNDYDIRYMVFDEMTDADGVVHRPRDNGHRRFHRILCEQVDGFTDEGASGYDDGIDALEMAIRLLGRGRGKKPAGKSDGPEESIQAWAEAGITWPKRMIPRECWTKEMWKETLTPQMAGALDVDPEMDPYE